MRIRALVAIVGLLLATVTVEALAVTQVKSVRLWRAPDNTRLVFDLSGPVQHSVFTLSAPDRLVIDINGATLAAPLKVATSNTPISSVRSAQRTPTDLRVVVDLKSRSPRKLHAGTECAIRQSPGGRPVRPGSRCHCGQRATAGPGAGTDAGYHSSGAGIPGPARHQVAAGT